MSAVEVESTEMRSKVEKYKRFIGRIFFSPLKFLSQKTFKKVKQKEVIK